MNQMGQVKYLLNHLTFLVQIAQSGELTGSDFIIFYARVHSMDWSLPMLQSSANNTLKKSKIWLL